LESLFESISRRLSEIWRSRNVPRPGHSYRCQCGRPVFFVNSQCLGCGSALGYEPLLGEIRALVPGNEAGTWRLVGDRGNGPTYRRCVNFESPAGCNWLVATDDPMQQCVSCRLNRTIPDLSDADNQRYWRAIENAKRRLVAQLLGLELPVKSKVSEDPEHGVAFDLLRPPPEGPPVLTGHANGVITLNVEEADDAKREKIRQDLHEPYRTLLGHFRHEIGHYYWERLVARTVWHEPYRKLFGDERADYAAALKANYESGPPADWPNRHISSYASAHPWEDWAETWAHFLHLYDALDTALGFGLTGDDVEMTVEPFAGEDLYAPKHPDAPRMLSLLNSWLELTTVLNELARSVGQPDFYPFVMSRPVVRKLHFIQLVIEGEEAYAHGP
jgi:hypothetical protein